MNVIETASEITQKTEKKKNAAVIDLDHVIVNVKKNQKR
jgi:hypothetical protein